MARETVESTEVLTCETQEDVGYVVYASWSNGPAFDNPFSKSDPRSTWFDEAVAHEWRMELGAESHASLMEHMGPQRF